MKVSLNLLPDFLLERFNEVGDQRSIVNPIIVARYFYKPLSLEWFAASYYPGSQMFYGWQSGQDYSLGLFSEQELSEFNNFSGVVVLDLDWKECRLSEVKGYVES